MAALQDTVQDAEEWDVDQLPTLTMGGAPQAAAEATTQADEKAAAEKEKEKVKVEDKAEVKAEDKPAAEADGDAAAAAADGAAAAGAAAAAGGGGGGEEAEQERLDKLRNAGGCDANNVPHPKPKDEVWMTLKNQVGSRHSRQSKSFTSKFTSYLPLLVVYG